MSKLDAKIYSFTLPIYTWKHRQTVHTKNSRRRSQRPIRVSTVCLHNDIFKVRKRANIRNWYNQAPHLAQGTNGKVITSQLDITNESQEVSPSQQVTTRHQQTDVHESITKQDRNNINDPQKKHHLGTVSKSILLEGLNRFNGAPTSSLVKMWIQLWIKIEKNRNGLDQ